jgi:hypothetical protein
MSKNEKEEVEKISLDQKFKLLRIVIVKNNPKKKGIFINLKTSQNILEI